MLGRAAWYWDKRGVRGDGKESELGMASGLLAELELKGRVVTGDALYAQRELSRSVLEQGGDYFWVVKDNQPGVREAVSLLFEHPPWGESFGEACQEGRHGDRWEHRRLLASVALNGYLDWPVWDRSAAWNEPGGTRGQQEAQGQGDGGAGLRHHQPPAGTGGCCQVAARSLEIWRGHWRIDNRLRWVRDVVFGEDLSQVRTWSAPQLLAALRNLVIGVLRVSGVKNISATLRHYGWKPWEAVFLIGLCTNN